jgi:hypothetical protein
MLLDYLHPEREYFSSWKSLEQTYFSSVLKTEAESRDTLADIGEVAVLVISDAGHKLMPLLVTLMQFSH